VREKLRTLHYSYRTEQQYLQWVRRYILFHQKRHPREMGAPEVEAFLSHLAVVRKISASTQNQALAALLFLYQKVLELELPWLKDVVRAKPSRHLPVVLTHTEVRAVLARLEDEYWLIGSILYGGGLRLQEALQLRVKDVDFELRQLISAAARAAKTASPSCPRQWSNHCGATWRWCAHSMNRRRFAASEASNCRTQSSASTRRRRSNGAGNTCSRRSPSRAIRAAVRCAGIMSIRTPCSGT
jgi:hypothetical protein